MSNRPFKTWTAAHGGSVIINAWQIATVKAISEDLIKVIFSNGGSEDIKARLSDFQTWVTGID